MSAWVSQFCLPMEKKKTCSNSQLARFSVIAGKCYRNKLRYPVDSDLSNGWCYPIFKQLGTDFQPEFLNTHTYLSAGKNSLPHKVKIIQCLLQNRFWKDKKRLPFNLHFLFCSNIWNTRKSALSDIQALHEKWVEEIRRSRVFLTNFEVFA